MAMTKLEKQINDELESLKVIIEEYGKSEHVNQYRLSQLLERKDALEKVLETYKDNQ